MEWHLLNSVAGAARADKAKKVTAHLKDISEVLRDLPFSRKGFQTDLPRVAFHASLHAFDVPIAVMTLVIALAWLRALSDWRWGLALGPLLGVAIPLPVAR